MGVAMMYKAVYSTSGSTGNVYLQVSLNDEAVDALLSMRKDQLIEAIIGAEAVECVASWSPVLAGYVVSYQGERLGVILLDELARATTVPAHFAEGSLGCRFAIEFAGAVVWRSGLLNHCLGQAVVLTSDESLSYLPASLWVPGADGDTTNIVGLAVGNVMDAFALTQQQLKWLSNNSQKKAGDLAEASSGFVDIDFDELSSLTEASIELIVSCGA